MAERSGDCSSDQDMESGPVEDPPLLVSPHRGEVQQSTEQQRKTVRPDKEITPGPHREEGKGDVIQTFILDRKRQQHDIIGRPAKRVRPSSEIRQDDEIRPNKPLQSEVNPDSEGEGAVQGNIFETAQSGGVQTVKNYLDLGVLPDLVDEQGWSILHHAASHGQVDVIRLLHSKGCRVDPKDRHGRTPLHHAVSSGACASIGVLVEELGSEVNPVDEDGYTPLRRSVECEQYAVMEELLRCGSMVFLDEESKALLFRAVKTGGVKHVSAMLDSGWPIDVVDSDGWTTLHWAARGGAVEMIHFLSKCGLDVNRGDKTGGTALHVAAQYGHQEVVSTLVDAGCPIDVVDSEGRNALHHAAWSGAIEMIHFLIKCGLDVNRRDKNGSTALHLAAPKGHHDVVSTLVDAGCLIGVVDRNGWDALHLAALGGAVAMIPFLIKFGLDVNRGDKAGMTALHVAAQYGHQKVVSTLVDAGCSIAVMDSNGWNALHWAAVGGAVAMIPFLIEFGLDVNRGDKTGRTALHVAARYGHQEVVSTLVDAGCPIDVVDSNGRNALHWAVVGGAAIEMIPFLIKCGLDVNSADKTGRTALYAATQLGHQDVVSTLVDAGCPIDVKDSNGWNALHWAAEGGAVAIIPFLIKCGLDVNKGSEFFGTTALHVAAFNGHQKVVSTLVTMDTGCQINVVDSRGWNALHFAAWGGAVEMISFLMAREGEHCFNVNVEDNDGYTPLHAACAGSQLQAASLLLRHGALLTKVAGYYGTPLHEAAVKENAALIDAILKFQSLQLYGSDSTTVPYNEYPENANPLNMCDSFGRTPAFRAADRGCIGNLERLVANNSDIRVRSKIEFSMFESAIGGGQMSQLQAIANACRVDAGSTNQVDLLHTLQAKGLLDKRKLLILGAIGGDPLVINSLSSEEDMFAAAAQQVWSDTYCRMLLKVYFNFSNNFKDVIFDSLCLSSACSLTPLQIAVIFLKYRTKYYAKVESETTKIFQTPEFIRKLITHPVSKFTVNASLCNGLSPLDVAQQFGLHDIADMIESAGGRSGMWADLPKEVQIPAINLYCSKYGRHLSSQGPAGLAGLSRVFERWIGVSPQLQYKSVLNQQTSVDAVLHQKPTRKLLIKHVLPRVTHKKKWRNLCILLDLEEDQVPNCSDQDDDDLYQAVLFAWLEQGSQVSWERLFDALDTYETGKTVKEMRAKVLEELQPSALTSPPNLMPLPPLPTHGVPHNRPALHRSREALLPHQRLMEKYRDRLLKVVPAKELALRWYNHQLVSDDLYYQLQNVAPCTARDILFRYFWDHSSQQSFEKAFCQIMVEEGLKGYHQAAQLGKEMQEDLMTQLSCTSPLKGSLQAHHGV